MKLTAVLAMNNIKGALKSLTPHEGKGDVGASGGWQPGIILSGRNRTDGEKAGQSFRDLLARAEPLVVQACSAYSGWAAETGTFLQPN